MTSTHVNPRTVETFFRIAKTRTSPPKAKTRTSPPKAKTRTSPPKAKTRTSPKTILSLKDSFSKVFETFFRTLPPKAKTRTSPKTILSLNEDKPKNIADQLAKLIETSNPDDIISKSQHEKARNILETTDINTLTEISSIIDNDKLYIKHKTKITDLLSIKYIELFVVAEEKKKLQILNERVKKIKRDLTKIEEDNAKRKYDFNISKDLTNLKDILDEIERTQKEAKIILTRENINSLPLHIDKRQTIIVKSINEKVEELEKLLGRANTILRRLL
jgi:hypothetical protein